MTYLRVRVEGLEIRIGQGGFLLDGATPRDQGLVLGAHCHLRVAHIEQGFGERRIHAYGLLVEIHRVGELAALLANQPGVIEHLRAALSHLDQALVQFQGFFVFVLFERQGGQAAHAVARIRAQHDGLGEELAG